MSCKNTSKSHRKQIQAGSRRHKQCKQYFMRVRIYRIKVPDRLKGMDQYDHNHQEPLYQIQLPLPSYIHFFLL